MDLDLNHVGPTGWREPVGFEGVGTRVLLYSQPPVLRTIIDPELVWLSPPPGQVGTGPADARMYTITPRFDKQPYKFPQLPPFRGSALPAVAPAADGHLDGYALDSYQFRAAHAYGSLRRVLDIWERYFGGYIPWHFIEHFDRLEIVSWLEWDNAHSGYGFLEAGIGESDSGVTQHYALNFDVLAHELGHSILYSRLGLPRPGAITQEYQALQESFADLIALVSVLHFQDFDERLLAATAGNLYQLNELNRIAELSDSEQIRVASNSLKMSDVRDAFSANIDACDEHRLGQPVTGACFDVLVAVYLERLRQFGVLDADLALASMNDALAPEQQREIQGQYAEIIRDAAAGFSLALHYARDYLGFALARVCEDLDADVASFSEVLQAMLGADQELTMGRYQAQIIECFEWREIYQHATWPSTVELSQDRL